MITIPRRIQYLLGLIALLFVTQAVFRLLFWGFISDLPLAAEQHLLQAYWIGIRFDLRIAILAALCTLPWLMLPRFSAVNYQLLMKGLRWWMGAMLFGLIAVYVLDAGHYLYLTTRMDASITRFATDVRDSTLMVWQSYPVIWISLAMAALWAGIYWLHNRWLLHILKRQKRPQRWWQRTLVVMLFGAFLLLMIMGRWSLVPLRWNHAYFHGSAEVAALGLNPMVWFYDTAKFKNDSVSKDELAPYMPELERLLGGPFLKDGHGALDRIVTPTAPVVPADETPNIVIVFLESLGNSHIGAYGNPLNPTPNLDALIRESRWYSNFIVPARSTAKSVFTSITGIPDVTVVSTASRNPYMTNQRSVINHFTEHNKYYMLGGSAGWANISATITNSIKGVTLLEEKSWQSPIEDVWGITDRDLFTEAVGVLKDAPQPYLAYIQSAANHSPHTIPDNVPGFTPKTATEEELEAGMFESQDQYNAVRLLDHNVKYMLDQFKQANMYDNSIFVFFADHQAHGKSTPYLPEYIYQFGIGELPVPLIIHSAKYIQPATDSTPGALPDLLPTIAGLFNQPYLNTTIGRDLAWAKGKNLPTYGIVQSERKSVVFNQDTIASVNHISGTSHAASIDKTGLAQDLDPNSAAAQNMLHTADAYYRAAQYLLRANVE